MILARSNHSSAALGALLIVGVMLGACATQDARRPRGGADRPKPLTVEQLQTMLDQGEPIGVMIAEIDSSGTVYRMTTEEYESLRSSGMPVAVLSLMKETYERAIRQDPSLAKSDAKWIKVGDHWYGGAPAGWPPK